MSNYLSHLLNTNLELQGSLQPRPLSRFEEPRPSFGLPETPDLHTETVVDEPVDGLTPLSRPELTGPIPIAEGVIPRPAPGPVLRPSFENPGSASDRSVEPSPAPMAGDQRVPFSPLPPAPPERLHTQQVIEHRYTERIIQERIPAGSTTSSSVALSSTPLDQPGLPVESPPLAAPPSSVQGIAEPVTPHRVKPQIRLEPVSQATAAPIAPVETHNAREGLPAGQESPAQQVVQVTIGRVEVRLSPPPASPPKPHASAPGMTLAEYLRRRNGGRS